MDFGAGLKRYFELQDTYRKLHESYLVRGVDQRLNPEDTEFISGTALDDYLNVGVDAMRAIVGVLTTARREPPATILDYPSGSGRVTRHLQAFFPDAVVVASDLYEKHLNFCHQTLKVETVIAKIDPNEMSFGTNFDLIFCGSLLTHFPEETFLACMNMLARSLSDTGVALITLHGRYSEYIQREQPQGWCYMPAKDFGDAGKEVSRTGFAYRDYDSTILRSAFDKQARYGVSMSRPSWTIRQLEENIGIRILGYVERGWHDHQDLLVIGKPGVNDVGN